MPCVSLSAANVPTSSGFRYTYGLPATLKQFMRRWLERRTLALLRTATPPLFPSAGSTSPFHTRIWPSAVMGSARAVMRLSISSMPQAMQEPKPLGLAQPGICRHAQVVRSGEERRDGGKHSAARRREE